MGLLDKNFMLDELISDKNNSLTNTYVWVKTLYLQQDGHARTGSERNGVYQITCRCLSSKKMATRKKKSHVFQAVYFLTSLAHRTFCVISSSKRCRMCPRLCWRVERTGRSECGEEMVAGQVRQMAALG